MKMLLFLLLQTYSCNAQDSLFVYSDSSNIEEYPYIYPFEAPSYPGGQSAMMKFISENIETCDCESLTYNTIYTSFFVEKNGTLSEIKIDRGLCPSFDTMIIELINKMPNWNPAIENNKTIKKVRVKVQVPIRIELR